MPSNLRHVTVKLQYEQKDITQDLVPYLKDFSFNDVMSGEADDISITLHDIDELWMSDWFPEKGAKLTASIVFYNWNELGDEIEMKCGQFEIDEITCKNPPHEVTIGAVSVPDESKLRGELKSRSWEKTTLKAVAEELAKGAGLELFYDTPETIDLDRVEQSDQSDLEFLMKVCKDNGLALKVSDKQVIIFDETKFEMEKVVATLIKGPMPTDLTEDQIKELGEIIPYQGSYSLKSSLKDIYWGCHVKHKSTKQKSNIEYTFKDPHKTQGKILQVNQGCETQAEAERLAKKKLRENNKNEVTGSVSILGHIVLAASATINLKGFGKFDGKYIISKCSHKVGGGYTQSLDIRRCLDGY